MTQTKTTGRGWAYACALLGGAVSVAANWAHSYVAPRDAPVGWTPEIGAVAFSVFWPIAVLAAVEAFARVPWPTGQRYVAIRFGGLLPVAVGAAVVSYLHLSGLLRHYGASAFEANFGPLVIDGLMLIGTGALIATSGQQRRLVIVDGKNSRDFSTPLPTVPVPAPGDNEQVSAPVEVPTVTPTDVPTVTPAPAITRTVKVPTKRTPKRMPRPPQRAKDSATKVADAHAKWPEATNEFIAEKTGASVRTVIRHRPARTNGHAVPELIETN